jgi:hypothetical protein
MGERIRLQNEGEIFPKAPFYETISDYLEMENCHAETIFYRRKLSDLSHRRRTRAAGAAVRAAPG